MNYVQMTDAINSDSAARYEQLTVWLMLRGKSPMPNMQNARRNVNYFSGKYHFLSNASLHHNELSCLNL